MDKQLVRNAIFARPRPLAQTLEDLVELAGRDHVTPLGWQLAIVRPLLDVVLEDVIEVVIWAELEGLTEEFANDVGLIFVGFDRPIAVLERRDGAS